MGKKQNHPTIYEVRPANSSAHLILLVGGIAGFLGLAFGVVWGRSTAPFPEERPGYYELQNEAESLRELAAYQKWLIGELKDHMLHNSGIDMRNLPGETKVNSEGMRLVWTGTRWIRHPMTQQAFMHQFTLQPEITRLVKQCEFNEQKSTMTIPPTVSGLRPSS